MKLKSKNNNEAIIEKFCAHSTKSAKYAKTVIKKRDGNEVKPVKNELWYLAGTDANWKLTLKFKKVIIVSIKSKNAVIVASQFTPL